MGALRSPWVFLVTLWVSLDCAGPLWGSEARHLPLLDSHSDRFAVHLLISTTNEVFDPLLILPNQRNAGKMCTSGVD